MSNGMVERFNSRIADVLKNHCFDSAQDMAQALTRYVARHNRQFPQWALKSKTPMQAMKQWCVSHPRPHLLHEPPYDRSEWDS
jgi:hypothetical protein